MDSSKVNEPMNYRRIDFSDVALYAVTPDISDKDVLLSKVELLLQGGVDAVQLRNRSLSDRKMISLGKQMKELCAKYSALFLIDNRVDIAWAVQADGLHLGHEDVPISVARELLGHRAIIGLSAHSLPEAIEAQRQGADYVSCGPLWATPTKPQYKEVGLGLIGLYRAALRIPYVAIGGVDEANLDEVIRAGAKSVAMVRALFDSPTPDLTAKKFKEKIQINRAAAVGR